jgi:hypothetical protein
MLDTAGMFRVYISPLNCLRRWWNWQTRQLEVLVPKGMEVQVLFAAKAKPRPEGWGFAFNKRRRGLESRERRELASARRTKRRE